MLRGLAGKVYGAVAAASVATVLATGTFGGFLVATGRLNAERADQVARVLRGELAAQPTTRPADTRPTSAPALQLAACTEQELRAVRERKHLESLEVERAAHDMEAQRRLLDQVLQNVIEEQEKLAAERKTATKIEPAKPVAPAQDSGFQKEVELFSALAAKQAKEHLLRVWQKQPADAVRLITAVSPATAKKVLEQFKTPEELQTRSDLLERIRFQDSQANARVSRRTDGAAPG
jgi:hypothetical protein